MGSEYQIRFQLFISRLESRKEPHTILAFTLDRGVQDRDDSSWEYGHRNPAVFVQDKKLIIQSAVNMNPSFETKIPLKVGSWMKIEISQRVIKNEVGITYRHLFINMFQPHQGAKVWFHNYPLANFASTTLSVFSHV